MDVRRATIACVSAAASQLADDLEEGTIPPLAVTFSDGLGDAPALIADLRAVVVSAQALGEDSDVLEWTELARRIPGLLDRLRGFAAALEAQTGIANAFLRMAEHYLICGIREVSEVVFGLAAALGAVTREATDGHTCFRLRPERLRLLVTQPAAFAQAVLGWGSANQERLLGSALRELRSLTGLEGDWFAARAVLHDAFKVLREFRVPLLRGGDWRTGRYEVGISVGVARDGGAVPPGSVIVAPYLDTFVQPSAEWSSGRFRLRLAATGGTAADIAAAILPDGSVTVRLLSTPATSAAAAVNFTADLLTPREVVLLGSATGSRLSIASLGVAVTASGDTTGGDLSFAVRLGELRVLIDPASEGDAFVAALFSGIRVDQSLDVALSWSVRDGFSVQTSLTGTAGTVAWTISRPIGQSIGPVTIHAIAVSVALIDRGLSISATAAISGILGPITVTVDGVGLRLLLTVVDDLTGSYGFLNASTAWLPPAVVGLGIDAGSVTGGGFLDHDPAAGRYAGIVQLQVYSVALKCTGLIETRLPEGRGYSFLIIVTAEFPPIQLGLGWTLLGAGGLAGLHRTVSVETLQSGVREGRIGHLLFPDNPVRDAALIISDLRTIFPPKQGRYVFAPIGKFGWGTPSLVTAEMGIILEVPSPVRLFLVGTMDTTLPDPTSHIVEIHLDIAGILDVEAKTLAIDGSLRDSRVGAYPITGDMAMRLKWGSAPNMALAIGGWNPAFDPPSGFPSLSRVTVALGTGDNPRITLKGYLAVTSQSAQVGAKAELTAKKAGFNIHGWVEFDTLFIFNPFSFRTDLGAGVSFRRGDRNLATVHLDATLTGPSPFHAWGEACYETKLGDACVPFDAKFGKKKSIDAPSQDPWTLLQPALQVPRNWSSPLPAAVRPLVALRTRPGALDVFLDPAGNATVHQRVAPLNFKLEKFGEAKPMGLTDTTITGVIVDGAALALGERSFVKDMFARGQFEKLSDHDKLSLPSFEPLDGGVAITTATSSGAPVNRDVVYETIIHDTQWHRRELGRYRITRRQQIASNRVSAAAVSAVETTGMTKFAPSGGGPAQFALDEEVYWVASTDDLSPNTDILRVPTSKGTAAKKLQEHVRKTPADSDRFQLLPGVKEQEPPAPEPPGANLDAIAAYTLIPWLRRGLGGRIARVDGPNGPQAPRPALTVRIELGAAHSAQITMGLAGPGEIASLDPRAVIRRAPERDVHDAECNLFPLVDLQEPDLPWRYSPARANGERLTPWLALICLADDEIRGYARASADALAIVTITNGRVLPIWSQLWAWAHCQLTGDPRAAGQDVAAITAPDLEQILAIDRQRLISRLICPRRLKPKTAYRAFIVPTFERGRVAGIGLDPGDVDALAPAWDDTKVDHPLPVYYDWRFTSGVDEDFESLARLLQPFTMPEDMGRRDMDVSIPGLGLPAAGPYPLALEGALRAVTSRSTEWRQPERNTFVSALANVLNLPDDLVASGNADPLVAPPLYGTWHARQKRLGLASSAQPQWFHEVNSDPRLRVAAGLGTLVVQQQQRQLMASAWEQVGPIREINEERRRKQVAKVAATRIYERHWKDNDPETTLVEAAPVLAKIPASSTTIRHELRRSPVANGAFDPQLRRITRPRGPLGRRQRRSADSRRLNVLERMNRGELSGAPVPPVPTELATTARVGAQLGPARGEGVIRFLTKLPWWLFVVVALMLLLAHIVLGLPIAASTPLGIVLAALALSRFASAAWRRRLAFRDGELTSDHLGSTRPPAGFVPATAPEVPGPSPAPAIGGSASPEQRAAARLFGQAAAAALDRAHGTVRPGVARQEADLQKLATTAIEALEPAKTIGQFLDERVRTTAGTHKPADPFREVMAAPSFDTPMYEPLRDLGQDWLLPGLDRVPANSIGLLETNQANVIEPYMLGLSHEMARELLWNRYPTDSKGTYFRFFWDYRSYVPPPGVTPGPDMLGDVKRIQEWSRLGRNSSRSLPPGGNNLVLLIRGELLRRYPNTQIYAVRATYASNGDLEPGQEERHPIFQGTLRPDVSFFGFDLTDSEVRATSSDPGWFFVLQEHPAEPCFGFDKATVYGTIATNSNELSWGHLVNDAAGLETLTRIDLRSALPDASHLEAPANAWHGDSATAATLAYATLQMPVRIVVHGSRMLPPPGGNP